MSATQTAALLEVGLGVPALVAREGSHRLGSLLHLLGGAQTEEMIGDGEGGRVIVVLLLRTRGAGIDLLDLVVGNFGHMDRRLLQLAELAHHNLQGRYRCRKQQSQGEG